jgi:alpha-amylase
MDRSPVLPADPGTTLPRDWQFGAMYQVFVRAFQDSDGDGVGDLRGVIMRLDYLKALGVSGIWLMPVMQSDDHDHGYAIVNYREIEPQYGTMADFDALIAAAHDRGIGVILDYVMNHSSARHPAFLDARTGQASEFREWYLWRAEKPTGWSIYGSDPWHRDPSGYYFGAFWGQMPDWNLRNPDVVRWHHDNLRFWLNRGVDGFRFDAVGNLIEDDASTYLNEEGSYKIVRGLEALIDSYENRYTVSEAPADPFGFARTAVGGSAFAFGHNADLVAAARGDWRAMELVAGFPPVAPPSIATFLSNHDAFAGQRVADQLGGNPDALKVAAALYLLQPGVPFIYYGEEIGMAGGVGMSADESLRTPMSWTHSGGRPDFTNNIPFRAGSANAASNNVSAMRADPDSLLNFYRAIITLRRRRPSLSIGGYENATVRGSMLAFRRVLDGEETLVAINAGDAAAAITLGGLQPAASYDALWPSTWQPLIADADGTQNIALRPRSVAVFGRVTRPFPRAIGSAAD